MIDGLAPIIDWYSIHLYTGQADHYTTVFQSHQAERAIRICAALIERARYTQRLTHPIQIAFDEWNVWYRTRTDEDRKSGIEERYSLSDALAVATYLHGFIRHCRVVRMANLAQLVNAIAPIFTSRTGLFLQTIYHPLRLYVEHMRPLALDVHVDAPTHELPPGLEERTHGRVHRVADLGPFPLLDVVATCDESGRELMIGVVNRDRDRPHRATIDLGGATATGEVLVSEVNGPDVDATNSFEARPVGVREPAGVSGRSSDTGSARSVSVLRVRLGPDPPGVAGPGVPLSPRRRALPGRAPRLPRARRLTPRRLVSLSGRGVAARLVNVLDRALPHAVSRFGRTTARGSTGRLPAPSSSSTGPTPPAWCPLPTSGSGGGRCSTTTSGTRDGRRGSGATGVRSTWSPRPSVPAGPREAPTSSTDGPPGAAAGGAGSPRSTRSTTSG